MDSYKDKVSPLSQDDIHLLADPQTSGGLLIFVDKDHQKEFEKFMAAKGQRISPFGETIDQTEHLVHVIS